MTASLLQYQHDAPFECGTAPQNLPLQKSPQADRSQQLICADDGLSLLHNSSVKTAPVPTPRMRSFSQRGRDEIQPLYYKVLHTMATHPFPVLRMP
jgi:hypothetical protein